MAPLQNLFALIETEEEDVSAIALAAIKADQQKPTPKVEANTKPRDVNNSMMTKSNRQIPPNGWWPQHQFTKGKPQGETNHCTNNPRNHGQTNGFQGNFRRNFGGSNGYHGSRRSYNRHSRNGRYNGNYLQGNNGKKKEIVVDADGWQVCVGHHRRKRGEITPENQIQSGRDDVQHIEISRNNFDGGDRGKVGNYGIEGSSRSVSESGVESEKLDHSGVEAGSNAATEGDRESKGSVSSGKSNKKRSGKGKNEGQDDSKLVMKKEEEEYKEVFTLKEYEEAQLEKRKALESIKQTEQRKVTLDKDFEAMLVLDKRDNDDKPSWEKEAVGKKKESIKGVKITKVMDVDELWKAANCIEERKRMRLQEKLKRIKGEEKEAETKSQKSNAQVAAAAAAAAAYVADANQFPALSALH